MENASKALIIAGSILISMMLVSFMVLFFNGGAKMSAEYDAQQMERELEKFNSQFEVYAKEDNNFFDILTVSNLAYDVNKKNGWETNNGIEIKIKKGTGIIEYSILNNQNLKKNYFFEGTGSTQKYIYDDEIIGKYIEHKEVDDKIQYKYSFNCKGENSILYNDTTGKVKEMQFTIKQNY